MKSGTDVMSAKEAAGFLRAHVETVRRLARRGEIPAFKMGKDWRFRKDALLRWSEESRPNGQNGFVLIVDDEDVVCRVLSGILEEAGYRTRCARNGAEGLDIVSRSSTPPGVILLDLMMPNMNGPQFLAELRETHPYLPVVIITGYPESDLMLEAIKYAPVMLLAKPIEQEPLERTIRSFLREKLAAT